MIPAEHPRRRVFQRVLGVVNEQPVTCVNCWNESIEAITMDCGHNICMPCFWKKSSSSCCTSCLEFSQLRTLQDDIVMHPEGEGMCGIHREDQKLFCGDCDTLLCVTCSKSEEHENHIQWSIAVAALRYRKKMKSILVVLKENVKKIQELVLKEKERPPTWIFLATDFHYMSRKTLEEKIHAILKYLMTKEEKSKREKLLLEKIKERYDYLYQKLKEAEANQKCKFMEQKKEWETMMSRQIRFLTDIITELQEKSQKPDLEMLQDARETLLRGLVEPNLKCFLPSMDTSYIFAVNEFLKFFQRFKHLGNCNYYDLSEETKMIIKFLSYTKGITAFVYINGNIQTRSTSHRRDIWYHQRFVEKEGCTRTIMIFSGFSLEGLSL